MNRRQTQRKNHATSTTCPSRYVLMMVVVLARTTVASQAQMPVGTAFTYQGQLKQSGEPVNGSVNLRFELYDAGTGGNLAGAISIGAIPVQNGLFTAMLDFGAVPFADNQARWLEVVVNDQPLAPRQLLTASPFSLATRGIRVDPNGNVDLGLDNPDGASLDIFTGPGTGWINFGSDMNYDGGPDGVFYFRHNGTEDGRTAFVTDHDEHLTIRNDGRIGVGVVDPSRRLEIHGAADADPLFAVSYEGTGEHYAICGQTWSPAGAALRGDGSGGGCGVYGATCSGIGVFGDAYYGQAVGGFFRSHADGGKGVHGASYAGSGITYGVLGEASSPSGFGVYSIGNFAATGTKSFQIDHPLDPANKVLNHYCAEGPEPLNVYTGTAALDESGVASIALPDYFEALNRDFHYQLTCVGGYAPVYIAEEIQGNRFKIAGGRAGLKVSWTVTGVRNDPQVRVYGAPVEQAKPVSQRGKFLQPELHGQPASLRIGGEPAPIAPGAHQVNRDQPGPSEN